jgi:hypothetical protein
MNGTNPIPENRTTTKISLPGFIIQSALNLIKLKDIE